MKDQGKNEVVEKNDNYENVSFQEDFNINTDNLFEIINMCKNNENKVCKFFT